MFWCCDNVVTHLQCRLSNIFVARTQYIWKLCVAGTFTEKIADTHGEMHTTIILPQSEQIFSNWIVVDISIHCQ